MFFSELYGTYYAVVAKIIRKAIEFPLDNKEIRKIVEENGFGESVLTIESSIVNQKWQLLTKEGTTPLRNKPTLPLTNLEKSWLKAISLDPRVKLFSEDFSGLEGVEPLFTPEDICIYDKYTDGDPYEEEQYKQNFRQILDAIQKKYPLRIRSRARTGREFDMVFTPEYLEYSEKDDKFRLVGTGRKYKDTVNLARIVSCEPYTKSYTPNPYTRKQGKKKTVTFEITDQRNALERVLMDFAHFERSCETVYVRESTGCTETDCFIPSEAEHRAAKTNFGHRRDQQAEQSAAHRYLVKVTYEKDDETEVLIRILSYGPMIKVVGPEQFLALIKERLSKQKSCGH